jgi:hypothetical protein
MNVRRTLTCTGISNKKSVTEGKNLLQTVKLLQSIATDIVTDPVTDF